MTPATGDLYWVDATVTNDRAYPTSSDRAVALGRAVMDRISVTGSRHDRRARCAAGARPWRTRSTRR
ncbi:MAG: hypothetical protein MZU84_04570 [Sphingobacterium sp.]|nr:hypothetical protein [Sphingobacterium sp.]